MTHQTGFKLLTLKDFGINLSLRESTHKSFVDSKKKDTVIYETKEEICGSYNDDLNILELNSIIIKRIDTENSLRKDQLEKEIILEKEKVTKPQSPLERGYSLRLIQNKQRELKEIITNDKHGNYTSQIKAIIDEYNLRISSNKVKILGKEDSSDKNSMIVLIEEFITIASRYVKVNINRNCKYSNTIMCSNCYNNINIDDINNESIITCGNCYLEIPKLTRCYDEVVSKDVKVFTIENQDEKNFCDAIYKYMGIVHSPKLDVVDFVGILDEYFRVNSMLLGDTVSNNYDKYKNLYNKALLRKALKATDLRSYYSDMEYIMNVYWGKKLNDISHLKDKLMEDYRISQSLYEKYKDPNKKSSMNVQYRLWRHLLRLGYRCDKSDFNIPVASFEYYESIWNKMCQELNWI